MNSKLLPISASVLWLTGLQAFGLSNGSFENDLTGWETIGNVEVKATLPYSPTHGNKLVAFNTMNTEGQSGLIQSLGTEPGHTYVVEFDVGNLGYNPQPQTLWAGVGGTIGTHIYTLAYDTVEIPGTTGGRTNWVSRSLTFTPQPGQYPTIAFWDHSTISDGLDLVLDNVRIREIAQPPLPPVEFDNGGFESGLDGWTAVGNIVVETSAPYLATEGNKLLSFNSGDSEHGSYVTRDVPTVPGQRYLLLFDVGNLAYNNLHQTMMVRGAPYGYKQFQIYDFIDIAGPGGGATAWIAASYPFTATSTSTNIWFADSSPDTFSTDLVLDNVRIIPIPVFGQFINGSFEYGFDGWQLDTSYGWASVESGAPYTPTDGSKLLAFSSGNQRNQGVVTQTVATTPGRIYQLVVDVGNLSFVAQPQWFHVVIADPTVPGDYYLLNRAISIPSTSVSGGTNWQRNQIFTFTARSGSTKFRFHDASSATDGVDLVIDNVRLVPQ